MPEFQCASLQAVVFLRSIYGFVVVDYNYYGMLAYRSLARAAAEIFAAAVECCHAMFLWDELSEEKKSSIPSEIHLIENRISFLAMFFIVTYYHRYISV